MRGNSYSLYLVVPCFVLRQGLCPRIAKIVQVLLQGAHSDPVSGEDMRGEVKMRIYEFAGNPATFAQLLNHFWWHIEIQAPLVRTQLDVHNSITIASCRCLKLVTPVLHRVYDRSEKTKEAFGIRALVEVVEGQLGARPRFRR